jgi:hypothetical protein
MSAKNISTVWGLASKLSLEPLKVHFVFVVSDSILVGEASTLQPQEKKLLAGGAWFVFFSFPCSVIYKAERKNVSNGWVMLFGFLHCQWALTDKYDPKHDPNLIKKLLSSSDKRLKLLSSKDENSYFHPRMKIFYFHPRMKHSLIFKRSAWCRRQAFCITIRHTYYAWLVYWIYSYFWYSFILLCLPARRSTSNEWIRKCDSLGESDYSLFYRDLQNDKVPDKYHFFCFEIHCFLEFY